jgi:hypothetical protein
MIAFRRMALAVLISGLSFLPGSALAYGDGTPDEQPPAEESICDPDAGLRGAAYGLCVAYCEANDCELEPDQHACEVLLANFQHASGRPYVPCVTIGIVQ